MQGLCFSRTAQVLTGALVLFGLALTGADPAQAQAPQTPQAPAEITVPNYWDPNRRAPKPDLTGLRTIRFLTEIEAPPFSYRAADGELTGFNVEIARGICRALEVACTIQALRWDLLLSGIEDGRGDAIIAAVPMTGDSRRSFQFSNRFLAFPGRFVARRDNAGGDVAPSALSGARVAVVGGTAHEAFLQAFYSESDIVPYETLPEARDALRSDTVDLLFADALTLSFWLNGTASEACCVFRGGPFHESYFFGEGMAVAVARDDDRLRQAIDAALWELQNDGSYLEIFVRSFPLGFY